MTLGLKGHRPPDKEASDSALRPVPARTGRKRDPVAFADTLDRYPGPGPDHVRAA
ncbi:hypothetical protein GCM10027449_29210 [Sinomonas notoginsengisoli]